MQPDGFIHELCTVCLNTTRQNFVFYVTQAYIYLLTSKWVALQQHVIKHVIAQTSHKFNCDENCTRMSVNLSFKEWKFLTFGEVDS